MPEMPIGGFDGETRLARLVGASGRGLSRYQKWTAGGGRSRARAGLPLADRRRARARRRRHRTRARCRTARAPVTSPSDLARAVLERRRRLLERKQAMKCGRCASSTTATRPTATSAAPSTPAPAQAFPLARRGDHLRRRRLARGERRGQRIAAGQRGRHRERRGGPPRAGPSRGSAGSTRSTARVDVRRPATTGVGGSSSRACASARRASCPRTARWPVNSS